MALVRRDEVLEKVLDTDDSAVPRFDVEGENGEILHRNVRLILKNNILTQGTPINKVALDEMLAASGVTAGTSTAYTLEQENFVLTDGALVRFRLHVDSGATPTLNVNGTGAKRIMMSASSSMLLGSKAGIWYTAIYSAQHDFFVLQVPGIPVTTSVLLTAAASSIEIPLPTGYTKYKLKAAIIQNGSANYVTIGAGGKTLSYQYEGIEIPSSGTPTRVYKSSSGTTFVTGIHCSRAFLDMVIQTGSSKSVMSGTCGMISTGGYVTFHADTASKIEKIVLSGSFVANTAVILEGVLE